MKALVVIPARGGSKGLPGKNIMLLGGKPLIQYTIEAARAGFDDSCIYVSTDSEEIKKVSESVGLNLPFTRPSALATDTANTRDVLLHALDHFYQVEGYEPEVLILLQPTSPLRTTQHIQEAMLLYKDGAEMVVSVKETKSNPYYVLFEEDDHGFLRKFAKGSFLRRQDCPQVWEYNGAIYIMNVKSLREKNISDFDAVVKYEMDERSSVDVDTSLDFELLKLLINKC